MFYYFLYYLIIGNKYDLSGHFWYQLFDLFLINGPMLNSLISKSNNCNLILALQELQVYFY